MKTIDIFIFSVNSIFPLIGLILLGYFLKRKRVISPDFVKGGSKLVFRVCLPVLLFYNIAELEDLSVIPWETVGLVIVVVALLFIIGLIVARFVPDVNQKGVMLQCVFRSNFALIGVPLAELIGGGSAVAVAAILSMFTIPLYNILGVVALTMYKGERNKNAIKGQLKSIVKNPLIIGVFIGMLYQVIKLLVGAETVSLAVDKLAFLKTIVSYISRMATPFALMVLGGQFEFNRVKGYSKQITVAVLMRTLVSPVIGVGLAMILTAAGFLHLDASSFAALIALFGTPVAVASAIMAEEMDNDGQLAAQLVIWTSLVSMFTLFIVIFVTRALGFLN